MVPTKVIFSLCFLIGIFTIVSADNEDKTISKIDDEDQNIAKRDDDTAVDPVDAEEDDEESEDTDRSERGAEDTDLVDERVAPVEEETELIPDADNRNLRENGAPITLELNPNNEVRNERENVAQGTLELNAEGMNQNEIVEEPLIEEQGKALKIRNDDDDDCKVDAAKCQENKDCCSGFCSWTRGFVCFSIIVG